MAIYFQNMLILRQGKHLRYLFCTLLQKTSNTCILYIPTLANWLMFFLWASSVLYQCPSLGFDSLRYLSGIFIGQPCWWRPYMLSCRTTRISALVKWEQVYKYTSALCHKSVWERHIRRGARSEGSSNYLQLWHIIIHCMACHSDCHNAQQRACTLSVLNSTEGLQKHRSFGENTSVTKQAQVCCSLWNGSGNTSKGITYWLLSTKFIRYKWRHIQ